MSVVPTSAIVTNRRTRAKRCDMIKTKVCMYFQAGNCKKDWRCDFLHGSEQAPEAQIEDRVRHTMPWLFSDQDVAFEPVWASDGSQIASGLSELQQRLSSVNSGDGKRRHLREYVHHLMPLSALNQGVASKQDWASEESQVASTRVSPQEQPLSNVASEHGSTSEVSDIEEPRVSTEDEPTSLATLEGHVINHRIVRAPRSTRIKKRDAVKTKVCRYFQAGNCRKNWRCDFLHGSEQCSEAQITRIKKRDVVKTKVCRYFQAGNCKKDWRCDFLHGPEQAPEAQIEDSVRHTMPWLSDQDVASEAVWASEGSQIASGLSELQQPLSSVFSGDGKRRHLREYVRHRMPWLDLNQGVASKQDWASEESQVASTHVSEQEQPISSAASGDGRTSEVSDIEEPGLSTEDEPTSLVWLEAHVCVRMHL